MAPPARSPASCLRRWSTRRCCPWRPSPLIAPCGRGPRSIPITTSNSGAPSTPCPRDLGHRVEVRGDARLVRIYEHGEVIKVHPPQPPGGRATDYTDYPAERAPYAMRAPDACWRRAEEVGPAVGQFVSVLLSGTFPWARVRQAQKLLRLAERYGAARLNAACARALAFELLDVRRVERIVRTALERAPGPAERGAVRPLPARFARPPESFTHHHPEEDDDDDGDHA